MLAFVKRVFGAVASQKVVALPVKSDIKAGRKGADDGAAHDAGHGPGHK